MDVYPILFWLIGAVAAGYYAQRIGRSYTAWAALSLVLTPILGFVLLLSLGQASRD